MKEEKLTFSVEAHCPRCGRFIFSVPSAEDLKGMTWVCPHYPEPFKNCGGVYNGDEEYRRLSVPRFVFPPNSGLKYLPS